MEQLKDCYIAIPVPENLHPEYSGIMQDVSESDPDLRMVNKKLPHITLLHLGKIYMSDLEHIKKISQSMVDRMKRMQIAVSGMGTFLDEETQKPNILYLNVQEDLRLEASHQYLHNWLGDYTKSRYFGFHPHVTVAYIEKELKERERISQILNSVNWSFRVSEIVLFGKQRGVQDQSNLTRRLEAFTVN